MTTPDPTARELLEAAFFEAKRGNAGTIWHDDIERSPSGAALLALAERARKAERDLDRMWAMYRDRSDAIVRAGGCSCIHHPLLEAAEARVAALDDIVMRKHIRLDAAEARCAALETALRDALKTIFVQHGVHHGCRGDCFALGSIALINAALAADPGVIPPPVPMAGRSHERRASAPAERGAGR